MPFPPVTQLRNLSREVSCSSPVFPVRAADKKSYRLNFRLKQLGKKASQYNSKLPTGQAASTLQLEGKCSLYTTPRYEDRSSTIASRTSCFGASSKSVSASSSSKGMSSSKGSSSSTSSETCSPQASSRSSGSRVPKNSEAVSFSLRLTPEAVLLLQRRNHEKQLRGSNIPQFRQRELSAKLGARPNVPLLKISLLNDRHQYDDVEYEDAVEQTVDQSVLLKCAEWLRGVEKAAETTMLSKVVKGSQKSI